MFTDGSTNRMYHNDGIIYDASVEIDKAIENLKKMGYNDDQIREIRKVGFFHDNKPKNVQESVGQTYERGGYFGGADTRLSSQDVLQGRKREVHGTGEIQISDLAKAEDSSGRVFRRVLNEVSKPEKLTDTSPTIMLGHDGVKNLPLMMKATHLRENILTEAEAKKLGLPVNEHIHYHGLGDALFLKVISGLDDVKEAYRGTEKSRDSSRGRNYFLLISEQTDTDGNTINIPVFINETAKYNNVFMDVNKVATVFGREQLRKYINSKLADGSLVRIKRRSTQSSEVNADIASHYRKNASSIDNSVSQNDPVVNTQSMQDVEKDSSDKRHSLVKSAQSELKALQKENEKLRQDVDDLKQELQLTHGRKLSRDALISSIQKILIDGYGVKLSAKRSGRPRSADCREGRAPKGRSRSA